MFNHRALSHFYRAWRKYRFPFAYEDTVLNESGDDLFTQGLYCLLGLATAGQRGRADFADEALLYFSGHFAHWPRSAVALEGVLNEYFQIPTTVKQFQGEWLYLAVEDRSALPSLGGRGQYTALGGRRSSDSGCGTWRASSVFALGRSAMPSSAVYCRMETCCGRFAKWFGFTPGRTWNLMYNWCSSGAKYLAAASAAIRPAFRLGWNTWVRHGEFPADVDDAIFASKI